MSDTQCMMEANQEIVDRLANHLMAAYKKFIYDFDGELHRLDGFMAVHNFHCSIIFHIERDGGMTASGAQMLRQMAIETLTERMNREPLP